MYISKDGATQIIQSAKPVVPDITTQTDIDIGSPLCPHCLAPIGQFDHFCPKCSNPITSHASIDPMGQVYAYGSMLHKAISSSSSRPKFIVVLGMWLLLGLPILLMMLSLFLPVRKNDPAGGLVMLVFALVFLAVYGPILWKVTSRYCEPLDTDEELDADEGPDSDEPPDTDEET
jgi:hypothetical protein